MTLGVSFCGFKSTCRLVICVDGGFLRHMCARHMLVAIALDANNHLYHVAFAMVDSENNNTWMYFMLKLREAIKEVENLMFVSDQHISIAHTLSIVFPKARHGACTLHVKMNINHEFKNGHCDVEFELTTHAYHVSEFEHHFKKIKLKDPRIATCLEEIGVEKYSRAFFLVSGVM